MKRKIGFSFLLALTVSFMLVFMTNGCKKAVVDEYSVSIYVDEIELTSESSIVVRFVVYGNIRDKTFDYHASVTRGTLIDRQAQFVSDMWETIYTAPFVSTGKLKIAKIKVTVFETTEKEPIAKNDITITISG